MGIMRTVATFALGYAAARGVAALRDKRGAGPEATPKARGRTGANAAKAEAWMKSRADRFRDRHTGPDRPDRPGA